MTELEQAELTRLESQVEHGGGGAWEYLSLVRKLHVRRSEKVLKYGLWILNDPKKRSTLGDEGILILFLDIVFWYLIRFLGFNLLVCI